MNPQIAVSLRLLVVEIVEKPHLQFVPARRKLRLALEPLRSLILGRHVERSDRFSGYAEFRLRRFSARLKRARLHFEAERPRCIEFQRVAHETAARQLNRPGVQMRIAFAFLEILA